MLLDTCVKASAYPHEAIKLAQKCKGEAMEKVKGTVSSVSDDIKPYVTKRGFKKYIGDAALSDVSRILCQTPALIHRDIKPGNVMMREDGTVKL